MSIQILALDLGTTRVKALTLAKSRSTGATAIIASASVPHNADMPTPPPRHEQDVAKILAAVCAAVRQLDVSAVTRIAITGQMHGVMTWGGSDTPSPLVTWMDARCGDDVLALFKTSKVPVRSGYGVATLASLARDGALGAVPSLAGSVMDFLVHKLTSLHVTSPSVAASFGAFDLDERRWQTDLFANGGGV
jgi:sugar (pentulose or hexulose) kinase